MKLCSAWGNYPKIECNMFEPDSINELEKLLDNTPLIPHGNGRSYGDSALSKNILKSTKFNKFISFDDSSGLLHIQAGVLLSEILEVFVPKGWFLKITPGTKLITVGGAIASDIHGKNHHIEGCFSQCVKDFRILLPNGNIVECSKEKTPDLWQATCGGMGLTGFILDAKIFLKRIPSNKISQTTIKTRNLQETFEVFEQYSHSPYSVAWIDCLAKDSALGRSLVMIGDFMGGKPICSEKKNLTVPFNLPSCTLNTFSVKLFNHFYYHKTKERLTHSVVDIDSFFYPLDAIYHWNRIYGKNGFVQYQFILPKKYSYEGLEKILWTIAKSGKGSFLAVLKLYGPTNGNWLSFPLEGYSLALDFKLEAGLFDLLDKLDNIVLKHHGRIYLTKDARVAKNIFEQGYENIEKFRHFRKEIGAYSYFESIQSQRLEL